MKLKEKNWFINEPKNGKQLTNDIFKSMWKNLQGKCKKVPLTDRTLRESNYMIPFGY